MFDAPEAQADPCHWSTQPIWRPHELAALWLGKDPRFVNTATVAPYAGTAFANEYANLDDRVARALEAGDLKHPIRPIDFVNWADGTNRPVDEQMRATVLAAAQQSLPTIDVDAMQQLNASLLRRVGELEASICDAPPRERRSMLVMIGAMARDKYCFDPTAQRHSATTSIVSAVQELGLGIDPKTVLKHLRESTEAIDDELALRGQSRNSA